ncbi:MAG: molybdenum cofactor guanylyltransferase, partial [Janthinobacterium lividum]
MQAIDRHQITGLLLAGGRATRMGEVDKGLMPFGQGSMASAVLQRITPQIGPVLINANRNLTRYLEFGRPVLTDHTLGHPGPLAGMQAGLHVCQTPYLLSVPCDAPFLPHDLALRLANALIGSKADVAVAATVDAG